MISWISTLPNAPETLTEEVAEQISRRLCDCGFPTNNRVHSIMVDLILYFCANREASMDDAFRYAHEHQKSCSSITYKSMKFLVYTAVRNLNEKKEQEGKELIKLKYLVTSIAYDEFISRNS